jgi:adenylate cyclase
LLEAKKRLEVQGNFIRKTFGRYLSDEVVDSILETPEGLELGGEKRVISIMMADLRGFTSLGERIPPEKVLSIINNFLKAMTEILARYNATIDEFIGDAILAMFGAPVQREDDAPRAVACAVEMQMAMEEVNRWNLRQGFPEVAMGIGINTGDVIVGNIGSERRAKYGIVGRNVNLTARIESCTVGGQILVSKSTLEACGSMLRIDGEVEVMPKGLTEPITIYEVGGIGGDFDLYLPAKVAIEIPPLKRPLKVRLSVLEGKHAARESRTGSLTGLAGNDALLECDTPLDELTDLKISLLDGRGKEISTELYAKVVKEVGETPPVVQVNFTSVPPEAERFLSKHQPTRLEK